MKRILTILVLILSIGLTSASQNRLTSDKHDVIKVTLDGQHKIVVNVVPNNTPARSVKSLMEEVGGVSAINGAFFCPVGYDWCNPNTSDMMRIDDGTMYSTYGYDIGHERMLIGFNNDGVPRSFTRDNQVWLNGQRTVPGLSDIRDGISMYTLVKNGINVTYNTAMSVDSKQGQANLKQFMCYNGNTVYMGKVDSITFSNLATYIINTFGCYNAILLDAGGSSSMIYNGTNILGPGRNVMDAVVVVPVTNAVTPTVTPVIAVTTTVSTYSKALSIFRVLKSKVEVGDTSKFVSGWKGYKQLLLRISTMVTKKDILSILSSLDSMIEDRMVLLNEQPKGTGGSCDIHAMISCMSGLVCTCSGESYN